MLDGYVASGATPVQPKQACTCRRGSAFLPRGQKRAAYDQHHADDRDHIDQVPLEDDPEYLFRIAMVLRTESITMVDYW